MQRLWLTGQVLPAGARLTVQHVFTSEEDTPLEVIYSFALPRDAAMRAFRITGDGFESQSELRPTEEAVKEYERGIAQGNLAALARQYGDGVVNLTVGNIRPRETVTVYLDILAGVELRDDGFRFRFPFTLAPSYHAQAKYAVTEPGEAEIELPPDLFGDVILPRFRRDASALHQIGFDLQVAGGRLDSPSHAIRAAADHVMLSPGHDLPNRDLILDAKFAEVKPTVLAGKGRFAAIIPSTSFGANPDTPRRFVILLDRSGSMQGPRITQAVRAIEACLGAVSDRDHFGLVAFSSTPDAFQDSLVLADREHRDKAHAFLRNITADGGTELASGMQRAVQVLGPGGGDVLIFTDGEVGGTEAILAQARAANVRLHCLGIGDASQDRFLALLARETGGVSRYVTPGERVDMAAVDLFASVGRPIAAGLQTTANVQPPPPAAVFSGTPVLLFGEGEGSLELTWDGGGRLPLPIPAGDGSAGETIRLLQGSRLITDWESRYPAAEAWAPLEKRKQSRVAARLAELSREYGLASREMSLVAVVKRVGDKPGELPETRVVPVGTPPALAFDAYFGSAPQSMITAITGSMPRMMQVAASAPSLGAPPPPPAPAPAQTAPGMFTRLFSRKAAPVEREAASPEDTLFELAAQLEGDGGLPGRDPDERATKTIAAVRAFLAQGHTPRSGAFRSHVDRMLKFLASVTVLDSACREAVARILDLARHDRWKDIIQATKAVKK
jgi:Ca-activated chloride channel family protein